MAECSRYKWHLPNPKRKTCDTPLNFSCRKGHIIRPDKAALNDYMCPDCGLSLAPGEICGATVIFSKEKMKKPK
ncbi:hypothetical protein ACFL1M_02875 [Patescibacteria group bacterium]